MKNTSIQLRQLIHLCAKTVLTLVVWVILITSAHAQRSSFEHPIPLDSLTLRGSLSGSDHEQYYSFSAGAHKTALLFEVKSSGNNAGATFDLFDKKARPILSNVMVQSVNRSAERLTETFQLGRQQEVILRVKGIRYGSDGGQGQFLVKIGNEAQVEGEPRDEASGSSWDDPVWLEDREWRDQLDGGDDEQYFAFIAAPGTLKLLFEVQASAENAGATFDLFDAKHRPLLANVIVQSINKSTEREQQSIRIAREQKLILRVKGVRYGSAGGQGVYRVRLTGNN